MPAVFCHFGLLHSGPQGLYGNMYLYRHLTTIFSLVTVHKTLINHEKRNESCVLSRKALSVPAEPDFCYPMRPLSLACMRPGSFNCGDECDLL